jgi:hypothetical protein
MLRAELRYIDIFKVETVKAVTEEQKKAKYFLFYRAEIHLFAFKLR